MQAFWSGEVDEGLVDDQPAKARVTFEQRVEIPTLLGYAQNLPNLGGLGGRGEVDVGVVDGQVVIENGTVPMAGTFDALRAGSINDCPYG